MIRVLIDLLFYHLKLCSYVVIEIKKVNLNQSVVDEVLVEYSLRNMNQSIEILEREFKKI